MLSGLPLVNINLPTQKKKTKIFTHSDSLWLLYIPSGRSLSPLPLTVRGVSISKSTGACIRRDFPGGTGGEEPTRQCRRHKRCRFDPWIGNVPWRGKWTLQYSCLENPMDRGAGRLESMGSQRVGHDWSDRVRILSQLAEGKSFNLSVSSSLKWGDWHYKSIVKLKWDNKGKSTA